MCAWMEWGVLTRSGSQLSLMLQTPLESQRGGELEACGKQSWTPILLKLHGSSVIHHSKTDRYRNARVGCAASQRGEQVFEQSFGKARPDSMFLLGLITKPFTAVAAMRF